MAKARLRRRVEQTSPHLLRRIDEKMYALRKHPQFPIIRENRIRASFDALANVSSWCAHNPDLADSVFEETGISGTRELRVVSREAISRTRDAWFYLRGIAAHSGSPTDVFLTPNVLRSTAALIDLTNSGYRTNDQEARIFHPDYRAPPGFQVLGEVEALSRRVRDSKAHPIDKGTHVQLELVGIQPFVRANKRVGKLVGQSIHYDGGYPPLIVHPADRTEYCQHLREALVGGPGSEYQKRFYDFMALKMISTLEFVGAEIKRLSHKRDGRKYN